MARKANGSEANFTPELREALTAAVGVLRKLARYKLERPLARKMADLADRETALDKSEQAILTALTDFGDRRTIDKLSALVALKQLHQAAPDVVRMPPELKAFEAATADLTRVS